MKPALCPCCGQTIPGDEVVVAEIVRSGTEREIVQALLRRKSGMTQEQMALALWGHRPDGGPDSPKNIPVHLCKIRKALREDGRFALVGRDWAPRRYFIVKLDKTAQEAA